MTRYLRCDPAVQTDVRLFCFPSAGSGASLYYPWTRHVAAADLQICPIHLPGREDRHREAAHDRLLPQACAIADEMEPFTTTPYALFGHSLGALLAFEITRLLRARSLTLPTRLFVSSSRAPHLPRKNSPIYDLEEDAFLRALQQRYDALPQVVLSNREMLEMFLPVLRADFSAFDTYAYEPGEPLNCPVTAIGGLEDVEITVDDLQGWREQTVSGFQLHQFPGGHFYLKERREILLRLICTDLNLRSRPFSPN